MRIAKEKLLKTTQEVFARIEQEVNDYYAKWGHPTRGVYLYRKLRFYIDQNLEFSDLNDMALIHAAELAGCCVQAKVHGFTVAWPNFSVLGLNAWAEFIELNELYECSVEPGEPAIHRTHYIDSGKVLRKRVTKAKERKSKELEDE